MKITIVGTIHSVGDEKEAGTSKVREIVLHKKYHDPDSGELKGEDYYPVQVWKDKYPDFQAAFEKGSKMEITGFINGRKVEKDGKASFYMNITAKSFRNL